MNTDESRETGGFRSGDLDLRGDGGEMLTGRTAALREI